MAAKRTKRPATIKLNLVPPYIAAARKTRAALVLTVIVGLLILSGMGLWWRTNATEITRLNEVLQQKTAEAQKVLAIENEAQSKRGEVADITNALEVLDDIRKSGDEWSSILRKIAEWIPEDVKITSLTFGGAPTNAQTVVLTGYTTSVMKLRDFYSQLSQSALFTNVTLQAVDKNGIPVPVTGLPPVPPKEKPKGPEISAELAPPGQPSPVGGPSMQGGAPATGGPGMGMHGGPPMMGGPGMGAHGPGMGMHGGPGMGGPGAPPAWALGGGPMMGAGPMMGGGQQQAIVRDPTAPRNAVYFSILATLAKPVQVATKLRPSQPAGMPGMGMPGAMMGGPAFAGPGPGVGEPAPPTGAVGGVGAGERMSGPEREEVPME